MRQPSANSPIRLKKKVGEQGIFDNLCFHPGIPRPHLNKK
jgi:hypothetical protein